MKLNGLSRNFQKIKGQVVDFPLKVLKKPNISFEEFTNCINYALSKGKFTGFLKIANITPVHKEDDLTDKTKFTPVSILPPLSKVFNRLVYDQSSEYMNRYLIELICGYRCTHATEHTLFKLLQRWQNERNNRVFFGTILMDFFKSLQLFAL